MQVQRAKPSQRLLRARRELRADIAQLVGAIVGAVVGLTVARIQLGPQVNVTRTAELLYTVGVGTVGIVTIVYSLLFGVVQWTASAYSPRLALFRSDPWVWRTFAFSLAVFTFGVTAGLTIGARGKATLVVPVTAVLALLVAFFLIRELQTRAFRSMQLAHVLHSLTTEGRGVIAKVYSEPSTLPRDEPEPSEPAGHRTVQWVGPYTVVQQLDLADLLEAATRADALVVFRLRVGDTVQEGSAVADLHGGDVDDMVVRRAIVAGPERSFEQDPMLALRLLSDIAMRAASPAVSDPATVMDALDAIEDLLRCLVTRDLRPADIADSRGTPRVRLRYPVFADFLRTGAGDLLPIIASSALLLERLERLLTELRGQARPEHQRALTEVHDQTSATLTRCLATSPSQPSPTP